jgi:hypothetical protein
MYRIAHTKDAAARVWIGFTLGCRELQSQAAACTQAQPARAQNADHHYVNFILTSHYLYGSLKPRAQAKGVARIQAFCSQVVDQREKAGKTMTNLDRMMEFLVAGVFLWIGLAKIMSFRRRPKALGASNRRLPLGLPYGIVVAVGIFEIAAAVALVAPFGPIPQDRVALFAATGLALLTLAAAVINARRQRSAAPSMVLFLMALFIIVSHTI